MSITIDNPRTEALAHELGRREGLGPADAIARALEAQLQLPSRAEAVLRLRALRDDLARADPRPSDTVDWAVLRRWARDEPNAEEKA